jgi:hypothetical protein
LKKFNVGKIAPTLTRANQMVPRKSIDQRKQILITKENPCVYGLTPSSAFRSFDAMQALKIEVDAPVPGGPIAPYPDRGE